MKYCQNEPKQTPFFAITSEFGFIFLLKIRCYNPVFLVSHGFAKINVNDA